MNTWHYRLEQALSEREKTWKDLYAFLHKKNGIAKTSVYAWKPDHEKRSTMINGDNAALVCGWLSISPMWLFHNEGQSGLEKASDEKRVIDLYRQLSAERKAAAEQIIKGFVALDLAENAAHIANPENDPEA